MKPTQTILICPLDWGLGHTTRCVPIINKLLRLNYKVIIGADKNPLAFLQQEFPNIQYVVIPGYEVSYDEKGSFFKLFTESLKFNNFIKKEHELIDDIIKKHNIDIIISDNRYGLYSKKVKSILITHQLYPKVPIGKAIAHHKIEKLIANFDRCWIPDTETSENLSGDLAHLKPFNHRHQFIGVLSRFSNLASLDTLIEQTYNFDLIAILSGPEPQRSIFEKLILDQIEKHNLKAIIVRGLPNCSLSGAEMHNSELTVFNHLQTEELHKYIQQSKLVVCRAGYSSIMDLATLNKKAILVPTPGQTEQEYLAKYHHKKGNFYTQQQNELDLKKAIVEGEDYTPNFNFKDQLEFNLS